MPAATPKPVDWMKVIAKRRYWFTETIRMGENSKTTYTLVVALGIRLPYPSLFI